MRRGLTILISMTLIMSPCWSQSTTPSSSVSNELKNLLRSALIELENSNKLVATLQENLRIAEQRLNDSAKSGTASDNYLLTLESQLARAEQQVLESNKRIAELMIQSEQDSIYLSDLKMEIQILRDEHTEEVRVLIKDYERKIRIRNTIIIAESIVLVVVGIITAIVISTGN